MSALSSLTPVRPPCSFTPLAAIQPSHSLIFSSLSLHESYLFALPPDTLSTSHHIPLARSYLHTCAPSRPFLPLTLILILILTLPSHILPLHTPIFYHSPLSPNHSSSSCTPTPVAATPSFPPFPPYHTSSSSKEEAELEPYEKLKREIQKKAPPKQGQQEG